MNLNQLQKHYDKLTPRERLAAVLEAKARNDEQEQYALASAAPKKCYDVTHHYFLQDAWEQLAAFHMVEMLNMGCTLFQGEAVLFLEVYKNKAEHETDIVADLLLSVAGNIVLIDTAWQAFCKAENMDPDKVILNLPGSGVYSPDAPASLQRIDTLPALLATARKLAPDEPDPEGVAELAEAYRAALHRIAGEQSGGWG